MIQDVNAAVLFVVIAHLGQFSIMAKFLLLLHTNVCVGNFSKMDVSKSPLEGEKKKNTHTESSSK